MDLTKAAFVALSLILIAISIVTFFMYRYISSINVKNEEGKRVDTKELITKSFEESGNHIDLGKIVKAKEVESDGVLPASKIGRASCREKC